MLRVKHYHTFDKWICMDILGICIGICCPGYSSKDQCQNSKLNISLVIPKVAMFDHILLLHWKAYRISIICFQFFSPQTLRNQERWLGVEDHMSKSGGRSFGHRYESRVPFRCTERVEIYAARRICSFNSSSGRFTRKYANAPQKLSPAPCKGFTILVDT